MKLLLDTHALIWWMSAPSLLSAAAAGALRNRDNDVKVSAASAWEIATKYRLGKLPSLAPIINNLADEVRAEGFQLLDIGFQHGCLAGTLRHDHRDPFDRMLIAQSLLDGLTLVSNETLFDDFAVDRLW